MNEAKTAQMIKDARKRREMTQKEVADQLGISQSYISRLEKRILSRLQNEMVKASGS